MHVANFAEGVVSWQEDLVLGLQSFCFVSELGRWSVADHSRFNDSLACCHNARVEVNFGDEAERLLQSFHEADTVNHVADPVVGVGRCIPRFSELRFHWFKPRQSCFETFAVLDKAEHRAFVSIFAIRQVVGGNFEYLEGFTAFGVAVEAFDQRCMLIFVRLVDAVNDIFAGAKSKNCNTLPLCMTIFEPFPVGHIEMVELGSFRLLCRVGCCWRGEHEANTMRVTGSHKSRCCGRSLVVTSNSPA
mmetsp:Transcript_46962/g.92452  ORF Transcript_46962/g.92452 Transcript_46962/m.92452 type:complete len:246 (-) Transcript_46962:298-1035(-)